MCEILQNTLTTRFYSQIHSFLRCSAFLVHFFLLKSECGTEEANYLIIKKKIFTQALVKPVY